MVLAFHYSGGDPISYARILVFSPNDNKAEYQNGRTDRKGKFAFFPDTSGKWRFEVNDGRGHMAKGSVDFTTQEKTDKKAVNPPISSPNMPKPLAVVMGISLVFNLFFFLRAWKKKE